MPISPISGRNNRKLDKQNIYMNMNKNIHTALRGTLTALLLMVGVSTWAEEPEPTVNVAKIGETPYATLQAAISAATDGQTVELIADITETATYTIDGKQIIIDLGTFTITASHSSDNSHNETKVFDIKSTGNLTITGTGGITDAKVSAIFYNAGTLTINSGNYTTTIDDYGVVVNDGGTCTVNGGTLTGAYAAIYTNGTNSVTVNNGTLNGAWIGIQANAGTTLDVKGGTITASNLSKKYPGIQLKGEGTVATISAGTISGFNGVVVLENSSLTVSGTANIMGNNIAVTGNGDSHGTTININGGTITNDNDVAIYHPQNGTLSITDGTITGKTALEVRSGNVTISGGTFTATASEYTCKPNGNGNTTVGAALAIAQHTTKKDIAVTISGGTFEGIKAISESNPQNNDPAPKVDMSVSAGDFKGGITVTDVQGGFISGGTYSEAFPATYCVEGNAPYVDAEGHCTIVTTETAPADAEALSDGSYYKVLNNAVTAAGTTPTTIEVLKEPVAASITIPDVADITFSIADGVELKKPITNSGALTITSGTTSGAITIADVAATVKIASGVNTTSAIALSTELQTENVLKSSTTKESGYTTYWVEKKFEATVALTGEVTAEQTDAANALAANTSIKEVTGLATNQSLTITVKSVTLEGENDAEKKLTKATFDVKLFGEDGQEVSSVADPGITFRLPIHSSISGTSWVNLWHGDDAISGMNVISSSYVTVTTTSFSPFSYEIIETPIAQIGKTKYASVANAIDKATSTETEITLLQSVSEGISVGEGKNVKLTIGSLTVSGTITNNGILTIADGTISGAISNTGTGTLTISGTANITGAVSASAGTLAISGGTINNAITTTGTAGLNITGGTMDHTISVGGSGTNTISGGDFAEALTATAGTLTISGGNFSKEGDNAIYANTGTINITGGTFNNTTASAINPTSGSILISGGTFNQAPVSSLCVAGYLPLKNDANKFDVKDRWDIVDDTDLSLNPHLTNGNYTVKTAEYQRHHGMVSAGNAETMYGTICLPFAIKDQLTGMTLYKATEISGSTLTITAATYPVSAGTPLIFELGAKASNMTVTSSAGEGIAVNTEATNLTYGTYLRGTYTRQNITTGLENIYYLNGDTFHQAVSSLTVPAYRAYLDTSGSQSAKPMVLSIVKEGDEEQTTGISALETLEGMTAVYDLNGRKQSGLQRGINILRRADGSTIKVMVK